jgi:ethanolamine-phosphate phospho-lyase
LEKNITEFLKHNYNISPALKVLRSYDDLNYLVSIDGKAAYVLKLNQETEQKDQKAFLESQHVLMGILAHLQDYQFPEAVADKYGNRVNGFGDQYHASLLTYIPGKFLAEVPKKEELLMDFGKFLGRIDKILAGYRDPAIEYRHIPWDIRSFPEHQKKLEYLPDASLKKLIHYFIVQYRHEVLPREHELRKSIIHNDANDWNVLVEGNRIHGIIDFGDLSYTFTVNELAIAATYIAMEFNDPLEGILPLVSGYHREFPLIETELSVLYYLIVSRLGISLIMSNQSKMNDPQNTYTGIHEEKARLLIEKWISINPHFAEKLFRDTCGFPPLNQKEPASYAAGRNKFFSRSLSLSYREPIVMEKAAFQYMYGDHGKTWVDCVNNIMHVGHAHPLVVEAGQRQMAILNTNTRYYYDALTDYAERLLAHFPGTMNRVFFVNSGSAASDLAIRLARNYTGRKDIIVMEHGYHGNTTTGIGISHYKFAGKGGKGAEEYVHVAPIPDTFRGEYKNEHPGAGKLYAEKIDPFFSNAIAAFICEPVVGCGGQVMLPQGYLPAVYDKVRRAGGICIADEVQTGFGRVGSHFWAYEMYGVIPDIVVLGKPMGNGHPMGAVVCTGEIATAFENGMEFFSSFGGNPVSCEIGKAVLQVIESEALQQHAHDVGNFLLKEFRLLQKRHAPIGDVRGSGFFLGLELVKDQEILAPATEFTANVVNSMKDRGFLLSTDGPWNQVIKFKPPMCFSKKNATDLVSEMDSVLHASA